MALKSSGSIIGFRGDPLAGYVQSASFGFVHLSRRIRSSYVSCIRRFSNLLVIRTIYIRLRGNTVPITLGEEYGFGNGKRDGCFGNRVAPCRDLFYGWRMRRSPRGFFELIVVRGCQQATPHALDSRDVFTYDSRPPWVSIHWTLYIGNRFFQDV